MDELDEKVLDITQRQKRAMILRRYHAKVERARELAQKRLAPEKNIKKRAYAQARQIVRKRFAGARGAEYEKLGPSEKMAIDRAIEKKQALIKKLALRLIPRVKQAEAKRLQSFMKGKSVDNAGAKEGHTPVTEELNNLFAETFEGISTERKKAEAKSSKNDNVMFFGKFEDEKQNKSQVYKAIAKKAAKADVTEEVLGIVYDRGLEAWNENVTVSPQQYAFARVNSFVNMGRTYFDEDADLVDGLEEGRAPGTPSVKRYTRPDGSTALKSLNKWGKRRDWRDTEGGLAKAKEHAGVDKVTEEAQQTDENFIDGEGPGKPGDAARHGLKGKSASELKSIRSSDSASPRRKQLAHWMLNMHHNEETELEERGLWDNIHAKRERIKRGSGERMRKPGSKGAPTAQNFKDAAESVEKVTGTNCKNCAFWREDLVRPVSKDEVNENGGLKAPSKEYLKMSKEVDLATLPGKATVAEKGFCDHKKVMEWVTERMCCALWDGEGTKREFKGDATFMEAEDTMNGTKLVDKESNNSKVRKKIENVDRKPPHVELTKQMEIYRKIIEKKEGNSEVDPAKREIGTDSLVKAFKKDTPGQNDDLNESFNLAFQAGIGTFMTSADLGMKIQGGFALHPSVEQEIEEVDQVEEDVKAGDKEPVVVPAHKDARGNTIPAKTVMRKTDKKIIKSGNVHDGED